MFTCIESLLLSIVEAAQGAICDLYHIVGWCRQAPKSRALITTSTLSKVILLAIERNVGSRQEMSV
jgi:hypothetical protein